MILFTTDFIIKLISSTFCFVLFISFRGGAEELTCSGLRIDFRLAVFHHVVGLWHGEV